MKTSILLLLALIGCNGCKTTNGPPTTLQPVSDAAAASVGAACLRLTNLGCYAPPNGLASCIAGLTNMEQTGLAPLDLQCASTATTLAEAESCVGISCQAAQ